MDKSMDEWTNLMLHEPELAFRMLTVRYMMEDRGMTQRDVAAALSVTHQRVSQVLRPNYVRHGGRSPRPGVDMQPETVHAWLDRIEGFITDKPFTEEGEDWYAEARQDRLREIQEADGWEDGTY